MYDQHFLGYLKRGKQTFYQTTTSPHKGTDLCKKEHAAYCRPSMKLSKFITTLILQLELRTMQTDHTASVASIKTKLWTNLEEHQCLITKAVPLLHEVQESSSNYCTDCISLHTWEVIYKTFFQHMLETNSFTWLFTLEETAPTINPRNTNSPAQILEN